MNPLLVCLIVSVMPILAQSAPCAPPAKNGLRLATYNVSLNRKKHGAMYRELQSGSSIQARAVAEVIQQVDPDVLLVQELDKGAQQEVLTAFHDLYLAHESKGHLKGFSFRHHFLSNTGVQTGLDLDRNGQIGGPGDAQGFGWHPGQYGFAILSKLPFDVQQVNEFSKLLWRNLEGSQIDHVRTKGTPWYGLESRALLRLSSKNHVAIPIQTSGGLMWVLAAHPTPPVFDGPEDRNGRRNYDEIRLLRNLLEGAPSLINNRGQPFKIPPKDTFVVMGDLNADPKKGDGRPGAIEQLLSHSMVNLEATIGKLVPKSDQLNSTDPHDTSVFGLRVDYIIPSKTLKVFHSGLCRAKANNGKSPSDHFLVWMDVGIGTNTH
jgi:endonuclease/exonuclease/phosphatase family metal-dependent hydrolase